MKKITIILLLIVASILFVMCNPETSVKLTATFTNGTVTANGTTLTSDVAVNFDKDETVTLQANPTSGYNFEKYVIGDTDVTENPTTITMDSDKTIQVVFTLKTYQLTVEVSTGGEITSPTSSTIQVEHGVATPISATTNIGYDFVNWSVEVGTYVTFENASALSTNVVLTNGDATIKANFNLKTYQLTVIADTGGAITYPTSIISVNHGVETNIICSNNTNYDFIDWSIDSGGNVTIGDYNAMSTTAILTGGDATVKANFATWEIVGSSGFSSNTAYYTSIAIDSTNTPYIVYSDVENSQKATVKKYDGTSWVNVGSAGFSTGVANNTKIAIDSNDTIYVAYQDNPTGGKATVMTFNGTNWVNVGSAGFSAGMAYDVSLAIDSMNKLYVAYQDASNSNKASVMTYNGTIWEVVGYVGISTGTAYDISLAIDSMNRLYVAYQDVSNSNKASVVTYNGTNWGVVGSLGFTTLEAYQTNIFINNSNTPYIAFQDNANSNKATVMKFNGTNWEVVGSAGFSAGLVNYISFKIDSNNVPYIAYQDSGNALKATVMKFDGANWANVNSAGFSTGVVHYVSLGIYDDKLPFVAFMDEANSNKATVMRYD